MEKVQVGSLCFVLSQECRGRERCLPKIHTLARTHLAVALSQFSSIPSRPTMTFMSKKASLAKIMADVDNRIHITLHFYPTTDPLPAVPPLLELPGLSLLALLSRLKHPNCPLVPSLNLFKIALISGNSACSLVLASASVLSSSTKYILDWISEAFSVVKLERV